MAHTLTNAHVLSILGQPTFRHAVSSGALTANKAGLFDPSVVYALAATLVSTKRPEPTGRTKHQPYTLADLVKLKSKHLTPLEIQHVNGVSFVVCRCMCGVVKPIRLGGFVSGNIKTCGCRASSYGTRYPQQTSARPYACATVATQRPSTNPLYRVAAPSRVAAYVNLGGNMQLLRIRAGEIQRTLGTRAAAGYLRNQGLSLEGAVAILAINR